ncbi:sporulation protein YunB [Brevibacillus fluminis]|uniref:Sporulation protein YunB n=2 Tax=Brevibacillus fluminis TaxID=511487 RepID=A0A3M8DBY2_9BACL|nr:sporulation protein YunB [Brevibacillus fluminis]
MGGGTMAPFRFRRRRMYAPISRKRLYFFSFLIFLVLTVQSLFFVEQKLEPTVLIIAKQKAEQLAKDAISDAVTKKIAQMNINNNDFIKMEKDKDNKIKAINLDFKEYSRILGETTERIKNTLDEFEFEPTKNYIPIGLATGSSFLAEMGPSLPVTYVPIGAVKTNLETKMAEAGINMVLVTVYIRVEVTLRIVIPFATDQTTVVTSIPITNSLVIGDVPDYWYNNSEGKPDVPRPSEVQLNN